MRKEAKETKFFYERDFSEEEYVPMSYVMTKCEEEIRDFFGAENLRSMEGHYVGILFDLLVTDFLSLISKRLKK